VAERYGLFPFPGLAHLADIAPLRSPFFLPNLATA